MHIKNTVIGLCWLMLANSNNTNAQNLSAIIKADAEIKTGAIDNMIYGNFTEHLGRCIYGGLVDTNMAKKNKNDGFRQDVIFGTNSLGVTQVRWPGGNFASGYHWMDGIGDKKLRPKRKDLAWGDIEPNSFGTDEFLKWSNTANVSPYICVNLGIRTLDEARAWVEYCNAPTGFYYSDLRAKNGHPAPYNVKYWGLGNEIDGWWQLGAKNAEDYSKFALEAAKLMKWSDGNIKLIGSGSSNYTEGSDPTDWNRTILNRLGEYIDYISLHHYAGNKDNDHYKFMASVDEVEKLIKITEQQINEAKLRHKNNRPIYIAIDEYNVWYRAYGDKKLEEKYNMQDVLVVGSYLNCFLRNAHIVKMANMAQLVNVIAPMMITNDTLWYQTIFYPLQLISKNCQGSAIKSTVQCDTYDTKDSKGIPYLDVATVYNEKTKEMIITVVNRHLDKSIKTKIISQSGNLDNIATVYEINSPKITDENSVKEQKVTIKESNISVTGNNIQYIFPAHSFTMIKVKMN